MRVNIFICHTPFHNFICSILCREIFFGEDYKNIIISSVIDTRTEDHFSRIIIRDSLIGKLIGLQQAKASIKLQVKRFRHAVEFFLPHIDSVLGNYVFHNRSLIKAGTSVNFFYDGILMLDSKRGARTFPRLLFTKRLLGLSIFHYFFLHNDVLPVHSDRIKHIYTPLPEYTPGPGEKMRPIRFPSMALKNNNGHVIILGTDVGDNLEISYERIISFCRTIRNLNKILFKPHHADKMHIFQKSASNHNFTFDLVESGACVEELMSALRPELIIAPYMSSALINIKAIFHTAIRVICIIEKQAAEAAGDEIIQLAKGMGVEIVIFTKIEL